MKETGVALGFEDRYQIEWNVRFTHDMEEMARIDFIKIQTLAYKAGWLTINEIRELEGYGKIEGGDVLPGMHLNISQDQKDEDPQQTEQQTQNEDGDQI